MLRAWRAFDGFRGGDIRPWLLAIVRNCWRTSAGEASRLMISGSYLVRPGRPDRKPGAVGADAELRAIGRLLLLGHLDQ